LANASEITIISMSLPILKSPGATDPYIAAEIGPKTF
jgi:hypothetical protein